VIPAPLLGFELPHHSNPNLVQHGAVCRLLMRGLQPFQAARQVLGERAAGLAIVKVRLNP
jgi:hypothetical protein